MTKILERMEERAYFIDVLKGIIFSLIFCLCNHRDGEDIYYYLSVKHFLFNLGETIAPFFAFTGEMSSNARAC